MHFDTSVYVNEIQREGRLKFTGTGPRIRSLREIFNPDTE